MARRLGLFLLRQNADRYAELQAELQALLQALWPIIPAPPTGPGPGPIGQGHVETEIENGRIRVEEGLVSAEITGAIASGFPREVWGDAARVAYYESAWKTDAERNTLDRAGGRCNVPIGHLDDGTPIVSEQSIGLFQINRCAHGGTPDYWREPMNNALKAGQLYAANGWIHWQVTARRLGLLDED